MRVRLLTLPAALLVAASLAGCGGDDATVATDPNTDVDTITTDCAYTEGGAPAAKDVDLPPAEAVAEGETSATMSTSVGDFALTLDAAATPCTVNSWVSLAEQGYFDGTPCHRMTTSGIFVLQCGDPGGTGMGGPGYLFKDEMTGDETYPAGTLAMANSGPDTNGSQFFIVYDETPLPPSYTVFGTVDEATVQAIVTVAENGTDDANGPGDGQPKTPVDIDSATVG
jgi:peptidyl-prolyl cis-trans isomerase B (cyclophilin B)